MDSFRAHHATQLPRIHPEPFSQTVLGDVVNLPTSTPQKAIVVNYMYECTCPFPLFINKF